MKSISDLCHNIKYTIDEESDLCHIYTDKYFFMVPSSGLEHLRYGLEAHYTQNEYLLACNDSELKELGKIRPKRASIEEINYQLERKSYNGKLIKANDLVSRLPVFSQSRNRNGKQAIADKRWKDALKSDNQKVERLVDYYEEEENAIRARFPNVKWTRGTFAISPCHIYPAKKNRGEDSWTPDKILRDLSIVNKCFDKISSSPLQGKHATNAEEAQIAIDYLDSFDFDDLSTSRQIFYWIMQRRIAQNFYGIYYITDLDLEI
jgi:hypothetical protein